MRRLSCSRSPPQAFKLRQQVDNASIFLKKLLIESPKKDKKSQIIVCDLPLSQKIEQNKQKVNFFIQISYFLLGGLGFEVIRIRGKS